MRVPLYRRPPHLAPSRLRSSLPRETTLGAEYYQHGILFALRRRCLRLMLEKGTVMRRSPPRTGASVASPQPFGPSFEHRPRALPAGRLAGLVISAAMLALPT